MARPGDWASLMCAICMLQPPEAPPTAPRELRDIIACCLQRDPAKRWTAAQLLRHPFVTHKMSANQGFLLLSLGIHNGGALKSLIESKFNIFLEKSS